MHRLTARFLLILLLVGTFAPVALAIAAPAPHACCMRKPLHDAASHSSTFSAPASCCSHDCCRPLNRAHWANIERALDSAQFIFVKERITAASAGILSTPDRSQFGRAPPYLSVA
jgi:hypothetical protein